MFYSSITSPPESFGQITLDKKYNKAVPQPKGANVSVYIDILGITKVDCLDESVGLEMEIDLIWEDDRIKWSKGGPKEKKVMGFSSSVLK